MTIKKLLVSLTLATSLAAPVFALADHTPSHTIEQLQAQIAALQAQINALSQQQTQTPPAASSALQNNDSVRATTVLKIRSIAGLSGTAIAKAPAGATGIIRCNLVSGGACPATTNDLRWWYVDWDDASLPNGWSAEATSEGSFLVKSAPVEDSPSINYVQAKASPTNTIYTGEEAVIFGNGFSPNAGVTVLLKTKNAPFTAYTVAGRTNADGTQIVFRVPNIPANNYALAVFNKVNVLTNAIDVTVKAPGVVTQPSITVLSPNGGERLQQNQIYQVTWKTTDFNSEVAINLIDWTPGSRYGMQYGITNGMNIRTVPGQTSFSWTVPSSIPPGDNYKVAIGWEAVNDSSDAPFSIAPDVPTVSSAPIQISTGGQISQKLHYVQSSNSFYGIGSDNAVWKWDDSSKQWSRITDGSIKDDFHFISESDIYAIGLDNQIWHWNGTRWSQTSEGGKIQHKIWYVDGNHIYGIGMDNQIWRYGSAGGWIKTTSNGQIKDDFHFISESDIYGIGMDGQIWRWNGSAWSQISSGGVIKQKLHFFGQDKPLWGIGIDSRIWQWRGGSIWNLAFATGLVKDDFFTDGDITYGIGLDNQIWKFPSLTFGGAPSEKTFASLPRESSVARTNPEQQLANVLVPIQAQLNEIAEKIRMMFEGVRR